MGAAIGRQVIQRIHKFEGVALQSHPALRHVRLPNDAFHPSPKLESMPFAPISSANPKPHWYSPSGPNWGQRDADLELTNAAHDTGMWQKIDGAWQGCFLRGAHQLVVKRKDSSDWFFPRVHWSDSAVLAVPAKMVSLVGSPSMCWMVDMEKARTPHYLAVWDLSEWEGSVYAWHSWNWQELHLSSSEGLDPALRAFAKSPIDDLRRVLAKEAFFDMSVTNIKRFATNFGYQVGAAVGVFDVVFIVVQKVLQTSDAETLEICRKRLARTESKGEWCEELVQLDDASELLERQDQPAVAQERAAAVKATMEAADLKKQYSTKHKEIAVREKKAAAGRAKKPKKAERITIPAWPEKDVDMAAARACCPKGGHIWASQRFGNWQAHYEPHARVSRAWSKYGYTNALNECLKYLWTKHSERFNIPIAELPVDGLFDMPTGVASSSSSSAA